MPDRAALVFGPQSPWNQRCCDGLRGSLQSWTAEHGCRPVRPRDHTTNSTGMTDGAAKIGV